MEFNLPPPADTLLFSDGIIYTEEEINEVIDFVTSEDSSFAIKNAFQQICSIIHFARSSEQPIILNKFMALIIK